MLNRACALFNAILQIILYWILHYTRYAMYTHDSTLLRSHPQRTMKEPVVITFRAPRRPKRFFHPMSNATNVVISWCSGQFWKCLVLSVFIWEYHLRFELVPSHHYFNSGVQIAQVSRHFDKGCMSIELIVIRNVTEKWHRHPEIMSKIKCRKVNLQVCLIYVAFGLLLNIRMIHKAVLNGQV